MSQIPRDTGRTVLVAVKRRLKPGQKRPNQKKRKIHWTSILTNLRKYAKTLRESRRSEDGDNTGSQTDDIMPHI